MATVGISVSPPISSSNEQGPKPRLGPAVQPAPRRPTRSGRLGVDKQGEYTYKKTPSSTLMASLQLGLHVSIGSIEPKPHRDILMTDFEVVETVEFPANGSGITPAHKNKDFTFKTYSPVAFRFFREAFGIQADDYLLAMCAHPLREVSNPGASGSLFYLSADDAFILKTVQKKEAHFLQKLLPGYYLNLTQNKKTLLPKFFGLYRYKCGSVNIRIAVMNNLLPSTLKYHEKYDLKGSTFKRKASTEELSKSSPTYKDLDLMEKHKDGGVALPPEKYDILMKTVERDCKVLESFGIMDYSLLLGVHNIDQLHREGEYSPKRDSPVGKAEVRDEDRPHQVLFPSRIELSKNFSIISVEDIPRTVDGTSEAELLPPYPEGHIQGRMKEDWVLVYLGLIDILQSYHLKKKVEHTMKSMITDGNTVSVHNPSYYARRFQEFLEKRVFLREKVKPRGRKVSKVVQGPRKLSGLVRVHTAPHGGNESHRKLLDKHRENPRRLMQPVRPKLSSTSSPPLLSTAPVEGGDYHDGTAEAALPEIPVIVVHSLVDLPASKESRRGKEGQVSGKGVRFSDAVKIVDQTTPVREKEKQKDDKKDEETETGKKEDREETRVEREMDSVDFVQVKGTSTPINGDNTSLRKHTASPTAQTQTFLDSSNSYHTASSEYHGDGEGSGMNKESPLAPGDIIHEPSREGSQS